MMMMMIIIITSPVVGRQSSAISGSACLFVCLSAHISQKPHVKISPKFSVHVHLRPSLGPSLAAMR